MKKFDYETISVKEAEINLGNIISEGVKAPAEMMIAAQALIEDRIARLKIINEALKLSIKNSRYENLVEQLAKEGKISSKEIKPIVEISTAMGDTIKVNISKGVDAGFAISDKMTEGEIFETLVPNRYKKTQVSLDKKAVEKAFEDGSLPEILKGYVTKTPVEIVKLRKTIIEGGK